MAEKVGPRFFGKGNLIRWAAIEEDNLSEKSQKKINPWIEDLRREKDPLFLPRVTDDGTQETIWYGMARGARTFRQLQEELIAFVGPTYSDFHGQPTHLDPDCGVESVLSEVFGNRVIRLRTKGVDHAITVRTKLELRRELEAQRPTQSTLIPRPTGRILSDFNEAIRLRDSGLADSHISELRSLGRLKAADLLFLDVLAREVDQDWETILGYPELMDLEHPRRVRKAIIEAVYRTQLLEFKESDQPKEVITHFRESVWPQYRAIYSSREGIRGEGEAVDTGFMLKALTMDPPRLALRDTILNEVAPDAEHRSWLERLAGEFCDQDTTVVVDADPIQAGWDAYQLGDLDSAWNLVANAVDGHKRIVLMINCAQDSQSLQWAEEALRAVDRAPRDTQDTILEKAHFVRIVDGLRSLESPSDPEPDSDRTVPGDWLAWARGLASDSGWTEAVSIAEKGVTEWSLAEIAADHEKANELAELLDIGYSKHPDTLQRCLPHLLTAINALETVPENLRPIVNSLVYLVVTNNRPGSAYFRTLYDILEIELGLGMSSEDYRSRMNQDVTTCIEDNSSPSNLDDILDLIDLLIWSPCRDESARLTVFAMVMDLAQRSIQRVDTGQLHLLRDYSRELDVELSIPLTERLEEMANATVSVEQDPFGGLRGRSVALYSLQESVLQRVSRTLAAEGIETVQTFSDHGGTPALKKAAQTKDIFVIATRAAKHAATGFIEMHRPESKKALTRYPKGKGSASMLRELSNIPQH